MEFGILKGEKCNRNGCDGIIENRGKEGSCSCHISPPCGYCITSDEFCPNCDWDGREEQLEQEANQSKNTNDTWWQEQLKKQEERREKLHAQMRGELPIEDFDYENLSHTHFTMIKQGVYPDGMSREHVYSKVRGTFGGRFEYFEQNKFKFIAYTD